MSGGLRLAVLVPARDEEAALPGLLAAVEEARPGTPVLVVDNGSRDDTARVARDGGAEVVVEPGPGYGRACQKGLSVLAARTAPPDAVAFLDADDPAAAARLPALAAPLERGRADLVLGRRVAAARGADRRGVHPHAAAGNALVAAILRGLYACPARDVGPFRAARLSGLLSLELDDPDFGWNVQMEVRALRAGWRVREVPVPFRRRRAGRSKISGTVGGSARAGRGMLLTLARETLRPPGARRGSPGP